ncbi:MAG: hypothetical protein HOA66_09175, partial [Candidatus Marinimicrobia bacterium]|nr:hypothetical protein [Candidatus Neomarinimicrobiota bacterium]
GNFGDIIQSIDEIVLTDPNACEDDDAAVAAFGGCAGAVAALGCDFVFAGAPISDWCPESCDACPDEPVLGCMDPDACNYDVEATQDDGSCEESDCLGECGGSAYEVTLCEDTDGDGLGNPGSETTECVEGGRDVADGCDLPVDNILLNSDGSVVYHASSDIGGFQFDVEGATINSASGGDASNAGFMTSASGTTALGFSMTGGTFGLCGTMINLDLSGDATGLSSITISDATGSAIDFTYYVESDEPDLVADCSDMYPDCASNMLDCFGECDGSADDLGCGCGEEAPDECGTCDGSIVDLGCGCGEDAAEENFDCDGNCIVDIDCFGECGGSAYEVTLCEDTDSDGLGNPGSETTECVEGGRDVADGCDLPVDNILLNSDGSVVYNASSNIGGFQFNVDGATINSATGGDAGAAGMMMSANGNMVLGFSLTGGTFGPCGTIVDLSLSGDATGLSGFIISDATGSPIDFTYYVESDEPDLVADCSDMYPDCASNMVDCAGECDGMAVEECAGQCDGDAVEDCAGQCNGTSEVDCTGLCGGSSLDDDCGICGGDNSSCSDCAGVPFGDSSEDECGTCDNDSSNDCVQDCTGDWGGSVVDDDCGICGGDNSSCSDCAGVPFGDSSEDECGICDNDSSNDCVQDCTGVWGGTDVDDECGVCGGTVTNPEDCISECLEGETLGCDGLCAIDGSETVNDDCGICGGDNSSCSDCAGVPFGDSSEDECGTCDNDSSNDCVQDCNGDWGGSVVDDDCGICGGDNSSCSDCAGVPFGDSLEDECGTCDNDSSNDCVQDCNGDWGGTAMEDCAGECDGSAMEDCAGECNGSAMEDCAGECNGSAMEDMCGTCDSDTANDCVQDCADAWGGDAVADMCGTCDSDTANDCEQDCALVWGGTAMLDDCLVCDSDAANDNTTCEQDCDDVWGGTSELDDCGVCDS